MEPRQYMIAGTLALLIAVAAVLLVTAALLRRRGRRDEGRPPMDEQQQVEPRPVERAPEASVEQLDSSAGEEAQSAISPPIQVGPWTPPETPAPAHELPEVSLEHRIAAYSPAEQPASIPLLSNIDASLTPEPEPPSDQVPRDTAPSDTLAAQPVPPPFEEVRAAVQSGASTMPESSPAPTQRPRAVVRVSIETMAGDPGSAEIAPPVSSASMVESTGRAHAQELIMAAPIEIWFGEQRVGVKKGTRTYDQFQSYADALFQELRSAGGAGVR
jgi:hypothetical protein